MRKQKHYAQSRARGLSILAKADTVHLAGVGDRGEPILKTLHPILVGEFVAFHSAAAGEKMELLDKPVVLSAERVVAEIPSYFSDPERACPATTYYASVQVRGILERCEDLNFKSEVLRTLMLRFQPEGGHQPIEQNNPLYTKPIESILITRLPLIDMSTKAKVGQNKGADVLLKIIEKLWARGDDGDLRAIDTILEENPKVPTPEFLLSKQGFRLCGFLDSSELDTALSLVAGEYWNLKVSDSELRRSHLNSSVWVGMKSSEGALIATARAITDTQKMAWIFDVAVDKAYRGMGLGTEFMNFLLGHPKLRDVRKVFLGTRGAENFYRRLGFEELDFNEAEGPRWSSSESAQMMLRVKSVGRS